MALFVFSEPDKAVLRKSAIHLQNKFREGVTEMEEYKDIELRSEVVNRAKNRKRKFLRYKEAEWIYSIQHKKLLELADKAGAIYRTDGYVLINIEIFESYLERFHQPPKMTKTGGKEL